MAADRGEPALYRKVADDIKDAIAAGAYAAGTRLPSESELAERYSVSRGTIRQAFAALRADGVIASRRGARRVVIGAARVQSFGELLSFSRWARAMGEEPSGKVISLVRRPATELESERLAIAPDALIYHLTRVRLLSGRPVMIERGVFPDRVGKIIADMDMERGSVTERLEEHGIVFADAEHVIDAIPASAEDARLLGVSPRVPMLRERRYSTDLAGVPLESSDDRYLGSAVAFSVHNSVAVNALSRRAATPASARPAAD
jgi:GntR family transcriptional regulator